MDDPEISVMQRQYGNFWEFYPFYLSEHQHPVNRRMHFLGISLGLIAIVYTIVSGDLWWLLAGLIAAYACAWLGHFLFEKNRPATFKYPLYSFMGDWVMYKDIWVGKVKLY